MGKQWRKPGKVHGEAALATVLYPQGYLHRLQLLLRINKVYSWECLLITVRSVTAWDRRDWQLLPHCSSTMGAPSASPAPGVSKVQHKGHQPFSPYPVITQPEPTTPSPSSTQPYTARGEWDPFGHSHEQSYLGTAQGSPCSATTDLLIAAPPDVPACRSPSLLPLLLFDGQNPLLSTLQTS